MWPNCDCNFFIKLMSALVLSFAVVVNGFGNLVGIGDIIETTVHSCLVTEETTTETETTTEFVTEPTATTTAPTTVTTTLTTTEAATTTTTATATTTTTTTKPTTTTTTKPATTVTTNPLVTTPDEDTTATLYGTNANYTFTEIEALSDGSYVACGTKNNGLFTTSFIVKYDKDAKLVWEKHFSGIGSDFINFNDLAILTNGNIVVVGHTTVKVETDTKGFSESFIYILSPDDGSLVRSVVFGGKGEDTFLSVAPTTESGFVVCGKTNSSGGDFSASSNGSAVIISFNSEIVPLWTKYLNGSKGASAETVATDKYGNVFVSILTSSTDGDFASFEELMGGYIDTVVIKLDKNGNLKWDYVVSTSGRDNFTCVIADGSGGCVVAGYYELITAITADGTLTGLHNCGGIDGVVISVSATGSASWTKSVAGLHDDYITDISKSSKGYVVSGYTLSNNRDFGSTGNLGGYDGFTAVINNSGKMTSIYSQAGSLDDNALCVAARTSSAKIMVAGRTKSADGNFEANENSSDYFTGYVAPYTIG